MDIYPLRDAFFRLDGGAMFGIIPRRLWEKTCPPDESNRIRLGINILLIKAGGLNILVETGIGDKGDELFNSIYAIERRGAITEVLKPCGVTPEDVSIVINTHLHFDHAGGNTMRDRDGTLRPAFPNARYIVQRGALREAMEPNERTRGSYREEDFMPLAERGLFELIEGASEIVKGVEVVPVSGHTGNIQLVKVSSGGETALFLSDIIPTASHLRPAAVAGYDLYPLTTLEVKLRLVERAEEERWLLIFGHDPEILAGYLFSGDGRPVVEKVL